MHRNGPLPQVLCLGETGELSPKESAMHRISICLGSIAYFKHPTRLFSNVVKHYRSNLSFLWIAPLRDYASIHVDSESLHYKRQVLPLLWTLIPPALGKRSYYQFVYIFFLSCMAVH